MFTEHLLTALRGYFGLVQGCFLQKKKNRIWGKSDE